jgi:SAM-dependent methyltransferase
MNGQAYPTLSDAPAPSRDYRHSHMGEGESYHRRFSTHIHRSVVWEIEQAMLLEAVASFVPDAARARLLDFACGTGRVLALLEARVGVDTSPSMLAVAERELARSRLLRLDITRSTALDREQFDLVTAFRFFPSAEPALRDAAMAALARLLAPAGVLIFNNDLRCGSLRHRLRRGLAALGIERNRRNLHCLSDSEVAALIARHGLVVRARHTFGALRILKERRSLLPAALIRAVERWTVNSGTVVPLASHAVYVLGHDDGSAPAMARSAC